MVDKKSSKLDLYPTHKLCDVFIGLNKFNKVTVRPESKGNEAGLIEDQSIEIFLGPPLLSFGMDRVSDAEFSQRAYHLLKKYLQLEQRNVNARHTRFVNHLSWKTNEVVELAGSANSLSKASQKEDLHNACEAIAPGLSLAKMYAKATNDKALSEAISEVTVRLTKIFTEKEYLNEEKTCYEEWSNPFEYTSL